MAERFTFLNKFLGNKPEEPAESKELAETNIKLSPFKVLQEVRVRIIGTEDYEGGWIISTYNDQINEVILLKERGGDKHPKQMHVSKKLLLQWNPSVKKE